MAEKIGFIGLRNIGNPMSRRVLGAGFSLVAHDLRTEARDRLVKEGAEGASSPKDVASRAQKICLSLPNSPIVEQVCLGQDGIIEGAAAGTIVIDLTSGNPSHTAQICAQLAEKGIHMIDAGVSGGVRSRHRRHESGARSRQGCRRHQRQFGNEFCDGASLPSVRAEGRFQPPWRDGHRVDRKRRHDSSGRREGSGRAHVDRWTRPAAVSARAGHPGSTGAESKRGPALRAVGGGGESSEMTWSESGLYPCSSD